MRDLSLVFLDHHIPTREIIDPETNTPIGTYYDWWAFYNEGMEHKKGEKTISPSEMEAAVTLLQVNFLTSFGRNAFELAVTDQATRDRIYKRVEKRGLKIPENRGVAESWGLRSNLPTNEEELRLLHEQMHY